MDDKCFDIIWTMQRNIQFNFLFGNTFFCWEKNEKNKWYICVRINDNVGNLLLRRLFAHDLDEICGVISARSNNNESTYYLGSFENTVIGDSWKTIYIKGLKEIPFWRNVDEEHLTLHIKLKDVRRRYVTPIQYFLRSKAVDEKSSFEWIIQSQRDTRGCEFFSSYTTVIPRSFTFFSANLESKVFQMRIKLSLNLFTNENANVEISFLPTSCSWVYTKLKIRVKDGKENTVPIIELSKYNVETTREDFALDSRTMRILKAKKDAYYPEGKMTLLCEISSLYCSTIIENVNYNIFYKDLKEDTSIASNGEVSLVKHGASSDAACEDHRNQCLAVSSNVDIHKTNKDVEEGKNSYTTLNESLCKLMNQVKLCDVTLCAENKTFPCHKLVLCSRSPVFLAMFENDTREKDTGVVEISDVTSNMLDVFLKTLYTDTVEDLDWESTKELYVIANKYLVSEVVKRSTDMLKAKLSPSKVSDFLILVDDHSDEEMLEFGSQFFIEHAKEILQSDEWKILMSDRPSLIGTLLQKLALSKL